MTKDTALPVEDHVRSYSVEVAIDEVRVQVVAAMATWTRERISPTCRIVLRRRGDGFAIHVAATWDDAAGDAVNVAWVRACGAELARLAGARGDAGAAVR